MSKKKIECALIMLVCLCGVFSLYGEDTIIADGLTVETPRRKSRTSISSRSANRSGVDDIQKGKILSNIVIVKSEDGVGSGFICNVGGEKWLITNEHVARGFSMIEAEYLNGDKVVFEKVSVAESKRKKNQYDKNRAWDVPMEVATNRDLVRFKVKTNVEGLNISEEIDFGMRVRTFGNSDGAGVVTSLSGTILGVGPDKIEISVPIVQGNSGGALIDDQGLVIGVATYALNPNNSDDWVKTGTRFNQVRRFGVRFNGVKWKKMMWSDYEHCCRRVATLDLVLEYAYIACLKPQKTISAEEKRRLLSLKDESLRNPFSKIFKADVAFDKVWDEEIACIQAERDKGRIGYSKETRAIQERKTNLAAEKMRKERRLAIKSFLQYNKRVLKSSAGVPSLEQDCLEVKALFEKLDSFMTNMSQTINGNDYDKVRFAESEGSSLWVSSLLDKTGIRNLRRDYMPSYVW